MNEITTREMRPDELEPMLQLRNAVFGNVPVEAWKRDASQTAALALMGEDIVGAIPLSCRRFLIRPGQAIPVAFENAVGVREDLRGQGIGSLIIQNALEFMSDRCDALMVYRSAERSAPYRFYCKTGHVDFHYIQNYDLPEATRYESNVRVGTEDDLLSREDDLLRLFTGAYAGYAGFPVREPGYWRHALNSAIYSCLPAEFTSLWLERDGRMVGYALLSRKTELWIDNRLHILEMAVEGNDPGLAEELIRAAGDLAARRSFGVCMPSSRWHPYYPVLKKLGFESGPRMMIAMGQPMNPEAMMRSQLEAAGVANFALKIWTPARDFVLELGSGSQSATLEMKDETLVKLLFGRVDLKDAIRREQITMVGNEQAEGTLAEAFPFAPWIYHEIDYI